ncbi:hypothetical protein E2C01_090879 [Portunus trituberculatus]|uniref:Uncharacterized protein n=1 Tax=Portunus trituberculatus TaxID=210409 RepID=A0A5B7JRJ3_PORTR|nr:hypothetical protein [Portunus trituberculatus]
MVCSLSVGRRGEGRLLPRRGSGGPRIAGKENENGEVPHHLRKAAAGWTDKAGGCAGEERIRAVREATDIETDSHNAPPPAALTPPRGRISAIETSAGRLNAEGWSCLFTIRGRILFGDFLHCGTDHAPFPDTRLGLLSS